MPKSMTLPSDLLCCAFSSHPGRVGSEFSQILTDIEVAHETILVWPYIG